ncbi:MAG: nitroreductase family protein [Candidatus Zixiibacteriota bacterium]
MTPDDQNLSHHGVDDFIAGNAHASETMRLLIERSSCRSFYNRPIPAEILELILKAGIHAPTGGNLQPFSIIVVEKKAALQKLAELNEDQMFIAEAPAALIFCIDWRRLSRWAELEAAPFAANNSFRHFWISFQDTIIAAQNICTAADALGLGSVYVGTIIDKLREHRELLALPKCVFPVVLLSLGYPKARPVPKKKLPPRALVHREKYQDLSDNDLQAVFNEKYPALRREVTNERLEIISQVCRDLHGDQYADRCLENIRKHGYINAAQYYFGLHYRADLMQQGNEEYLRLIREFGFGWFENKPGRSSGE